MFTFYEDASLFPVDFQDPADLPLLLPGHDLDDVVFPNMQSGLGHRFLSPPALQDFGRQGYDLHELFGPELPRHRPEDAGPDRFHLRVDQDRRVLVEPDVAPVSPPDFLGRPHHHGLVDVSLLHLAVGDGLLDADDDDVPYACVPALAPAQDLDAAEALRARVVGRVQHGLHLDHGVRSPLLVLPDPRPLAPPGHPPPFLLAQGSRLAELPPASATKLAP